MNTIDGHTKRDLLLGLREATRYFSNSIDNYLDQAETHEILNPARTTCSDTMGSNEMIPPEFFAGFGIHRITLNTSHSRLSLSDQQFIETVKNNQVKYKWHEFKNQSIIADLKFLFKNARIIEFSDRANTYDASDIWDNLRRDVIQPLNKKDFDFIFDLREIAKRPVSDVSEILDIISDFSHYGRIILLLKADDAVHLWAGFNGLDHVKTSADLPPVGLKEVYRYLFDTILIQHPMHAHQLLIYTGNRVTLFCKQQKFELTGKSTNNIKASGNERDYFLAGYSAGLLLQLEISICIAFGMAVSGAYLENRTRPGLKAIRSYIDGWIGELETILPRKKLAINKCSEFLTSRYIK